MNVLILAPQPFYQQRGTPIAVRMLAETLASLGHQVDLLAYREGADIAIPGVALHRIPHLPLVRNVPPGPSWKKFPSDLAMFFSALRLVRSKQIHLIHAVEESAFLAMALKVLFSVPYVYDMDSSLAEQTMDKWKLPRLAGRMLEWMESLAIRHSMGVVAVCKALEERARACAPHHLVHCIEDVTLLQPAAGQAPNLRDELGISGPLVLYVGNLESYQGIDLLLETFAAARTRCSGARLVVIGGTVAHIDHYRRRSATLGIGAETFFVGPRPLEQLDGYLRQADVLMSPRIQGRNTPMKIYSYLDSGRPVLATRLPTHTQVLDDNIAMLAAPEPLKMADGLVRLLSDPDLGRSLAERARTRVALEYSPAAFQRKVTDFYRLLCDRIHPAAPPSDQAQTPSVATGR
jgi:glycosyltransferase involved in cell wall biosynthesis